MKLRLKSTHRRRAETFKTIEKLRTCLLVGSCIALLPSAAIMYSAVLFQQSEDIQMKTISLVLSVVSLPTYIIIQLICEFYRVRKEQKKIERMVCKLTEDLRSHDTMIKESNQNYLIKDGHTETTKALIHRIVQFINA